MKSFAIAMCLALLLLPACNQEKTATTSVQTTEVRQELSPEQLGELGAKIKKQPNDAQRLLAEHGLSEESFEQAIRKVSEDPEAAKRYAAAYRQASV
jgi:hypothetical protein